MEADDRETLYSVSEYLTFERASEEWHEYIDGRVSLMAGVTLGALHQDRWCVNKSKIPPKSNIGFRGSAARTAGRLRLLGMRCSSSLCGYAAAGRVANRSDLAERCC